MELTQFDTRLTNNILHGNSFLMIDHRRLHRSETNIMKKRLCNVLAFAFCLVILLSKANAQDIHFSQFFETPLLRNPALAGIFTGDIRLQAVYRNQWNSVTVPYQTGSFNGEYKKPIGHGDDFLTLGGEILYDKAGTVSLSATHILPTINYHKSLSTERNMYLSLGFMGGWVQRRIDQSKITTNSQYTGTTYNGGLATGESFTKPSYSYLDASVGMSFNAQLGENKDNNIFLGAAYQHFNKARSISFYGNPDIEMIPKWVGSLGARFNMNESSFFTLQADFSKQGTYQEFVGGVLYSWKLDDMDDPKYIFHTGLFMRWKDALIPVAKLDVKPVSISVSYDANVSQLKSASQGRGGFEIALGWQKFLDRDNSSRESIRCPQF